MVVGGLKEKKNLESSGVGRLEKNKRFQRKHKGNDLKTKKLEFSFKCFCSTKCITSRKQRSNSKKASILPGNYDAEGWGSWLLKLYTLYPVGFPLLFHWKNTCKSELSTHDFPYFVIKPSLHSLPGFWKPEKSQYLHSCRKWYLSWSCMQKPSSTRIILICVVVVWNIWRITSKVCLSLYVHWLDWRENDWR